MNVSFTRFLAASARGILVLTNWNPASNLKYLFQNIVIKIC